MKTIIYLITHIHIKVLKVLFAGFLAVFGFFPSSAVADITLTFGTYAAVKPTATARKFIPFLDFLAKDMSVSLGEPVKINIRIASEYQAGIEDLTTGRVDFSRFGPASYVTAKTLNPDIQIIVMESKNGEKKFKGVIAIHTDSKINRLSDLRGRSFAFGDELSTIGRYLAQANLLDAGVSGSDLESYAYLGRHDKVGAAVGRGTYDAGALKENTFKKLQAKNTPIKALYKFDNITKPWIASSTLSPRIFQALSAAMLKIDDPDALKNISKSGFLKGKDQDYDIIRSAMEKSTEFN